MSDMTHLDELEAEAIYIMREVVAECEKPVMLYSIGKDSSVMLHLALKAFYPEKPPFPFLHVNTTWKFKEMIEFRDKIAEKYGLDKKVVYPHSFRHRYAKNFLEKYNDIALLADLMGHESIETTRIYLRRTASEQQELVDKIVTW